MFIFNKLILLVKPFIERFPRIATMYRGARDQLSLTKGPIVTPWGFKLAGNKIMAEGVFEPEETELVRNILKDVDVLVNVGANVGYYCCHALSMGKAVIAFEPIQQNLYYLLQNIKVNGWAGAEINPIALSNEVGVLKIYGGGTGASVVKGWADTPQSFVTLAMSSTMNEVLGNRLRGEKVLILVDVEGAEKSMLEGATKMLANVPKPIWLIEISVTEHQPQGTLINPHLTDTFKCMFDAGYQAFTADKRMSLVTMDHVKAAQEGNTSLLQTHNFLFR